MQCKDYLLFFKYNWVTLSIDVFKMQRLSSGSPLLTKLYSLRRQGGYALANHKNQRVYITGGKDSASNQVDYLDLFDSSLYCWKRAPKLRLGKYRHGSISLGEHIYVFGGKLNPGYIEALHVGQSDAWQEVLYSDHLTSR